MLHLPLNIVTYSVLKWIASCYTYEQLATCDDIIHTLQHHHEAKTTAHITRLVMAAQMKRIDIQLNGARNARQTV